LEGINLKLVIWIVKNPARLPHFNNFQGLKKFGRYLSLTYAPKNRISENLLNKLLVKFSWINMIYTDSEYENRKKFARIWWNTPLEIPDEFKSHHNFIVTQNPIKEVQNFQFYPILGQKRVERSAIELKPIVYIAEVDLPSDEFTINLWNQKKDILLSNFQIIREKFFWDQFDLDVRKKFEIFSTFQNLFRIECIQSLKLNPIQDFILIGDGWKRLGFTNYETSSEKSKRVELYSGSICLDFGSKSGSDSLYQRSIEIIESGGILLQALHPDSRDVFGLKLSQLINFSSTEELNSKIKEITGDFALRNQILECLSLKFSDPTEHYSREFSKIIKK
jgi:hypothetical protein